MTPHSEENDSPLNAIVEFEEWLTASIIRVGRFTKKLNSATVRITIP